jgi:PAS domain S-box-containing protein
MVAYFQSVEGEGRREKDSAVSRRRPATTRESEATSAGAQAVVDRARARAMLAGEALRLAHDRLTQAQRLSHPAAFTMDIEAHEHTWSQELFRILELEPETKMRLPTLRAFVHRDDLAAFDARFERSLADGSDLEHVFRVVTVKGTTKYLHALSRFVEGAAGRRIVVGSIQDVTECQHAAEALKVSDIELRRAHADLSEGAAKDAPDCSVAGGGLDRARAELAHVTRATAMGALAASIAHEVSQPLVGIITNASTCLRMLSADAPDIAGAKLTLQRVMRDGHRASEVIKRLRGLFARKPPESEPVDLNDAAREILVLSSNDLQRGRVVLQTDFAGNLPIVAGDRVQLQQVIRNLVLNAAQAMGGVEERPHHLGVSTARDGTDQVTLSVRDCGVGAAGKDLEQLFNAFYTTKPDGMGVGLSISRSIIEAHGGRLWARANDGPGLTVSLSLPVPRR